MRKIRRKEEMKGRRTEIERKVLKPVKDEN